MEFIMTSVWVTLLVTGVLVIVSFVDRHRLRRWWTDLTAT